MDIVQDWPGDEGWKLQSAVLQAWARKELGREFQTDLDALVLSGVPLLFISHLLLTAPPTAQIMFRQWVADGKLTDRLLRTDTMLRHHAHLLRTD